MAIAPAETALFASAAGAYTVLMVLILLSRTGGATRAIMIGACALTTASTVAVLTGWGGAFGAAGAFCELTGSGGWLLFVLYLITKRNASERWLTPFLSVNAILIGVSVLGFAMLRVQWSGNLDTLPVSAGELASRLAFAIFGILLIENLYRNTVPEFRWHVNILCIAIGSMFCYGVIIYADALLFHRISTLLWDGRAIVLIISAPLIAVAVARNRDWFIDIHVSRSAVFHTATLVGSGVFLLALAITGEVFRAVNPSWGGLAEITLIVAGATAMAVVLSSGFARSWIQRTVLDNFFSHRFDYRREWLRSIEILSTGPNRTSVQSRVISAIAEIVDSPSGALWVRDLEGAAFLWAGSWNCLAIAAAEPASGAFIDQFRGTEWIIEVQNATVCPQWLADIDDAWLVVPLAHRDELIGFVALTEPRAPLKLDREIFDLLRIVGRQAATHIAEQRYAQALSDTLELDSYGKRFAFAIHDMKNVSGQLAMILQNARRHKDDPQFQEDVLSTVRSALERLNRLLDRLRANRSWSAEQELITPSDIVREEVVALQRSRGSEVSVDDSARAVSVVMDAGAFRSVIRHLCENAIEASPGEVELRLSHDVLRLQIDISDKGAGMTPEFIRDQLFQPFGSTKTDGLGIGAYQARALVRAAGGDLLVASQPGRGTKISILLPCNMSSSKAIGTFSHEQPKVPI